MTDLTNMPALLDIMTDLAIKAGAEIMAIYATDFAVEGKADASPVTEADRAGEAIITAGLQAHAPDIAILAEEAASAGHIPALGSTFFLVDPLDGTREFVSRTGEFTVNIALIRDGKPVLGVVYAPALGLLYTGDMTGADGYAMLQTRDQSGRIVSTERIRTRARPESGLIAVASRSHRSPETDDFLNTLTVADFIAAGSSLKFCRLAAGEADVYPRLGRTMEWDTAAGQAVLEAAGGRVVVLEDNTPLTYAKKHRDFDNPHFVAWGQ